MANEIIRARLQTPQDDEGNRKDIMVITDATSVIMDGENPETSISLKDKINKMEDEIEAAATSGGSSIYLSRLLPDDGNGHLWGEIVTDYATADYEWTTSTSETPGALLVVASSMSYDDYNPNTMIKLNELMAYDSTLPFVEGDYVIKSPKTPNP